MIIAVDCDDVLVPTAESSLDYYNAAYGTQVELKDLYSNDLTLWDVPDHETAIKRVEAYHQSDAYRQTAPLPGAIETIGKLGTQHELHLISGRPDSLSGATTQLLKRYFPGMFSSIELTNFFGKAPRSKGDVCQQLGVDVLIDDHLHHAEVVAACGINVLLFGTYPWNQAEKLPAGVRRVKDWAEVARILIKS